MSNPPIIKVDGISKKYYFRNHHHLLQGQDGPDHFWALSEVSFTLEKGDTLGIIGSNGSGKTTLLKILSQSTAPSSGTVTHYGRMIPIIDIGSGFHPDLSGRENIYLYGTVMLGLKKATISKNIAQIIDFSELGEFIDEPVKNYSNGMYLRLALSIALFCDLDILLLDEIFSVGDSSFMQKSYEKMSQIIKSSATVILASHNMDDIMRVCKKCLWLEKGVIKMQGNTNEVISAYMEANQINSGESTQTQLKAISAWSSSDAPQTPHYRLRSVSIHHEGQKAPDPEIDYNLPFTITIECEKLTADSEVGFSVILTDSYNTTLLITANRFHGDTPELAYGRTGVFRYTCQVPAQLLTIGIYKIHLEASLDPYQLQRVSDVLVFQIRSSIPEQIIILKRIPIKIVPTFLWRLTQI